MHKTCAFSGHRILKGTDFDNSLLDKVVLDLIKTGTTNFLCGMALGFDLIAAETVLMFKKQYDVKLIACLPCADQSEKFSESNKRRYDFVLGKCDEVVTLASEYYRGCMHERDRYMVDNCDVVVSFLRKESGGTYYTVNYAKKSGKKVIVI